MIAFEKAGNELSASVGETSSWKTSYKLSRDDRSSLTSRTRGKQVPGSALVEDVMSAKLWETGDIHPEKEGTPGSEGTQDE